MYYWSHRNIYVVLNDEQEMGLVKKFSNDNIVEIIGYDTHKETRKYYEKKINQHLKQLLLHNPEEFEIQYHWFSYHSEEAQEMFPHILKAFGWKTKKAAFGKHESNHSNENPLHNLYGELYVDLSKGPSYCITLAEHRLLPWPRYQPHSYIYFSAKSIKRLEGTVSLFFITTDVLHIRFASKSIELFVINNINK